MLHLDDYSYTTNGGRPQRKNNPASSRPKPTPSKWDDAQKWLVGGGRADGIHGGGMASKPRNSNADDRRLLGSSSQNGRVSCSSVDGALEYNSMVVTTPPLTPPPPQQLQLGEGDDDMAAETKKMMVPQQHEHGHGSPVAVIRSVCLRDMGTEMTPIASKEPSRTATPLRASTPVARSPISSRSSTPARRRQAEVPAAVGVAMAVSSGTTTTTSEPVVGGCAAGEESHVDGHVLPSVNSLESRAVAWDEAERAKFTARLSKPLSMKADQMKTRAQEKLANRLAATRRIAEEKRATAEAKLNERAARTSEKANYIRRTGHLPSSFFKMTCLCG
nr:unnamed protein product [Digitaria exilis]